MTSPLPLRVLVGLLLVTGLLLPYVTGGLGAYVSILLAIVLSIWQYARAREASFDPAAYLFLAAFALLAIAFALTGRPGSSDVAFTVNFVMFALYAPLSAGLRRVASARNGVIVASLCLAGTALALGVACLQVLVWHMARAEGWGSNPIPSATAALFLGFIALMGYPLVKSAWRNLFLLGPVAGMATVFLAASRGPLVALPALTILALLLVPIRRAVLVTVAAIVILGSSAFFIAKPETLARFSVLTSAFSEMLSGETVDADVSTGIRYQILRGSLAAFAESPWIGHGWYGKIPAVRKYIDVFPDETYSHLHSDILNLGVSAGVVGLLAYVLVLLAPVISAWRSSRDSQYGARRYGAAVLSVGYFFCGAVNLLFGFEFMTTFYVVVAAALLGFCRDASAETANRQTAPSA